MFKKNFWLLFVSLVLFVPTLSSAASFSGCETLITSSYAKADVSEELKRNCMGYVLENDLSVKMLWMAFPEQVESLLPPLINFISNGQQSFNDNTLFAEKVKNLGGYTFFKDVVVAFNFIVFGLGLFLYSILLIKEFKRGATEGQVFGSDSQTRGYAITKSILGFMLISPIAAGFTMGQYFVIFCALLGIMAAIYVWVTFLSVLFFQLQDVIEGLVEFDVFSSVSGDNSGAESMVLAQTCDILKREELISKSHLNDFEEGGPINENKFNSCLINKKLDETAGGYYSFSDYLEDHGSVNTVLGDSKNTYIDESNLLTDFCSLSIDDKVVDEQDCGVVAISSENKGASNEAMALSREIALNIRNNFCLDTSLGGANDDNSFSCVKLAGDGYAENISMRKNISNEDELSVTKVRSENTGFVDTRTQFQELKNLLNNKTDFTVEDFKESQAVEILKPLFSLGWTSSSVSLFKGFQIDHVISSYKMEQSVTYDVLEYLTNEDVSGVISEKFNSIKNRNDYLYSKESKNIFIEQGFNLKDLPFFAVAVSGKYYSSVLTTALSFEVLEQLLKVRKKAYLIKMDKSRRILNKLDGASVIKEVTEGRNDLESLQRDHKMFEQKSNQYSSVIKIADFVGGLLMVIGILVLIIGKLMPLFVVIFFISALVAFILSIFKQFIMTPAFGMMHLFEIDNKGLSGSYNYGYSSLLAIIAKPLFMIIAYLVVIVAFSLFTTLSLNLVQELMNNYNYLDGTFMLTMIRYMIFFIIYIIFFIYAFYKSIKLMYKIPDETNNWLNLDADSDSFWSKFLEMANSFVMARINGGFLKA